MATLRRSLHFLPTHRPSNSSNISYQQTLSIYPRTRSLITLSQYVLLTHPLSTHSLNTPSSIHPINTPYQVLHSSCSSTGFEFRVPAAQFVSIPRTTARPCHSRCCTRYTTFSDPPENMITYPLTTLDQPTLSI